MTDKSSFTTPTDPYVGQIVSNEFKILKSIGIGGMGTVYKALQDVTQRFVAVKILHRHMIDQEMIQRFEQEARIISQLNHSNIVTVFRYGQHEDGSLFIAMEYLQGKNLADEIKDAGHFPVARAQPLMIQMADALGYAHEHKIVHRDIRPENLVIVKSGRSEAIKVLDFGISKIVDENFVRTKTGMLCGSPAYMAPEQWLQERNIDGRLDIYALGCVYYNMLTGQLPFNSESAAGFMNAHLHEFPPPSPQEVIANLKNYPQLIDIVLRCIQREPADRYADAYTLADDLRKLQMRQQKKISALDLERVEIPEHPAGEDAALPMTGRMAAKLEGSEEDDMTQEMNYPSPQQGGHKKSPLLFIALGAVVVLAGILAFVLLSGTGDGTTPAQPSDVKPAVAQPVAAAPEAPLVEQKGVTATEIKLGMSSPFSGPAKELGRNMRLGVESAVIDINAAGGIHGRNIKLISLDDGYEPDRTVKNMNELLNSHEIFAVIGNVGTPTAKVAVPIAMENKTLFFGGFTGASLLRKDPPDRYVFNYRASYAQETAAMVKYFVEVKKFKPEQIAVFAQEDAFGDDGFSGVAKMLRKYGQTDSDKILRVGYKRNTTKVDTAVKKILNHRHKIRAIVMVCTYMPAAKFITSLQDKADEDRKDDFNFATVSFVGSAALAEEFKNVGKHYGEGVIVTQVVPHYKSGATGVLKYRDMLKKNFPSEQPSFVSLEGYVAMSTLAEGLLRAGRNLHTESLIDALESIQNYDIGVGSVLSYGLSKHQGSDKVWGTQLDANADYQMIDLE